MDARVGDEGRRVSFPRADAWTREGERSRERRVGDARARTDGMCVVYHGRRLSGVAWACSNREDGCITQSYVRRAKTSRARRRLLRCARRLTHIVSLLLSQHRPEPHIMLYRRPLTEAPPADAR